MGDHALYALIEYLFKYVHEREIDMSYTLDFNENWLLYTHVSIYVCIIVQIDINCSDHTYIYRKQVWVYKSEISLKSCISHNIHPYHAHI